MGGDLLSHPGVKKFFLKAEEILSFPLFRLVKEGPEEEVSLTENAQPALFVLEYAVSQELLKEGIEPEVLLGHSLGEITALAVASVFSFEDGVRIARKRGELMQREVKREESAMVALIKPDLPALKKAVEGEREVFIANYNSPDQVVLSGKKDAIERFLREQKGLFRKGIPLKVSAPFHTPFMRKAGEELYEFLKEISISPPRYPVVSNFTADLYPSHREGILSLLRDQIFHPVRFYDGIEKILSHYLPETKVVVELPPAGVLKSFFPQEVPMEYYSLKDGKDLSLFLNRFAGEGRE
jgi:[acyl-carrier-protein] S-malonyltransferase